MERILTCSNFQSSGMLFITRKNFSIGFKPRVTLWAGRKLHCNIIHPSGTKLTRNFWILQFKHPNATWTFSPDISIVMSDIDMNYWRKLTDSHVGEPKICHLIEKKWWTCGPLPKLRTHISLLLLIDNHISCHMVAH